MWKGCPGIKMFSTVGRQLKSTASKHLSQPIPSRTVHVRLNQPSLTQDCTHCPVPRQPGQPQGWGRSALCIPHQQISPRSSRDTAGLQVDVAAIYISNIWLQVKSLKQELQASQADNRHRQPSVRPTSCTCGCYSRLLHVHAGIKKLLKYFLHCILLSSGQGKRLVRCGEQEEL